MEKLRSNLTTERFLEIARQEFWIVVKSFFIPIYGIIIGFRELVRTTQKIDRIDRNLHAENNDRKYFIQEPAE